MPDNPPRGLWRITWDIATGDGVLVVLLLGIAAGLILAAWLPQEPASDPGAYARWLSTVQARFGEATSTMQALGLFTITDSLAFRALLALLAASLSLRLGEGVEQLRRGRELTEPEDDWQELDGQQLSEVVNDLSHRRYRVLDDASLFQIDRWPWADLFPLLAYAGALLVLVGLLLSHLWGWRVEGLIMQSGERATLRGTDRWVALRDRSGEVTHSPGVVTFVEDRGPGLQIRAVDDGGDPLALQQTVEADPSTELTVALTDDQYFAIPGARMIARLTPESDDAYAPVDVQVYRSLSGQLITEAMVERGEGAELSVERVTLRLTRAPYARVTATFNPGLWPAGAGLLLLIIGLLGHMMWPARRFWLREGEGAVEGAGGLPPTLVHAEE